MASVVAKNAIRYAFTPTPSDTVEIKSDVANTKAYNAVGIYVTVAGNVSFVTPEGQTINLLAVPAFTLIGGSFPMLAKVIRSTGTSATVLAVVVDN